MQDHSPLAPEERRKRAASLSAAFGRDVAEKLTSRGNWFEVVKRIAVGVYNDGFIHAGNLAYLSLLALFPFFILAAAVAQLLGQSESSRKTVATILAQLPPNVSDVLSGPIAEVLSERTGPLLWIGAIVALVGMTIFDLSLIFHLPGYVIVPIALLVGTAAGALNGVLIV